MGGVAKLEWFLFSRGIWIFFFFFFFVVGKLIERVDVEFRFGRFADGEGRFKTF